MDLSLYIEIERVVLPLLKDFDKAVGVAVTNFPNVGADTLHSIIAQLYTRFIKVNHRFSTSVENRKKIYKQFLNQIQSGAPQGIIVRLAIQHKTSPALAAKIIVEEYLKQENNITEQKETANNDKRAPNSLRLQVNQLTKNHSLIEDCDLAYEVLLAKLKDHCYGHIAESIKQSIGEEHEQKIKDKLKELNIPFSDEHVFRSRGYDKTPDVKLEVPVAINGKIINWIESKALFGDRESHERYLKDQFWPYWNRFGSGLVIYWFGYIKQLDNSTDNEIVLCDHLPTDIVYYNPDLVSKANRDTSFKNNRHQDRKSVGDLIPTKRVSLSVSVDDSMSNLSLQDTD